MNKTVNIKFSNSKHKPMQPENITVDDLYGFAEYAAPIFEYSLNLFKKKFQKKTGIECNVSVGPQKERKRVEDKLKEADIEGNPSNILDILRGTVTVETIEDLLEFLNFTRKLEFTKKDFSKASFDEEILSGIKARIEKVVKKRNFENHYGKKLSKEEFDSIVDKELTLAKKRIALSCEKMEDLPMPNVAISNSFSFNVDNNLKQKYDFLTTKPRVKNSNYMDFKFYVCIPIPTFGLEKEKDYMICEVIATLNCFDKVYDKTHCLLEKTRNFKEKEDDDIEPDTFKLAFDTLSRCMYVDGVIEKYNNMYPNKIQIVPHNDDKMLREDILNKVSGSITLTKALCNCRD